MPPDLRELNLGSFKSELIGQRVVYRMEKGKPVPYYTRAEIDGLDGRPGVLRGKGLELAWLSDPVDAFFLQVQGSGRLRFEDGKEMPVRFAGSNGKPYLSIGRYLADQGEIPTGQVSMQSIRQWLREHPELRDDLLRRNQRYIFFRKGPETSSGSITSGPVGSMGSPLSSMVSLAVDRTTFPLGSVLAFDVNIPDPSSPWRKAPSRPRRFSASGWRRIRERPSRDAASTCSAARARGRPISRGTSTAPVKSGCCWRSNTCL